MSLCLQNLKDYRDEILKAEIGALLFNLGKTHIGFWKEKNGKVYFNVDDKSFKNIFGFKLFSKYNKYYKKDEDLGKSPFEYELEKYGLKDFIFSKQVKFPFDIDGKSEIKWVEFFKGDASNENFIKEVFFRGCENINSGIDKGSPSNNKQLKQPLWLSNAFGGFKEEINEENFDKSRIKFFKNLYRCLKKKKYLDNSNINWKILRNYILRKIKKWYSHLLSDNRMPVNDVTLYDQAYMSASMFKATLAGILLNTNESKSYTSNPQSIKWQILGVQYDKLALAEKGLKPAHIVWYREASKQVDEKVKEIIELEYALGNEIYRDESGIYFIVPEGIGTETLSDDLSEVKDKILYAFKDIFNNEVYPYIGLTKPSRGTMNLTYLLDKAKENFLKADYSKKSQICVRGNEIGICQICKSRLVKEKSDEDEVPMCDICKERKKGRRDKWLENQNGETIWIDEIGQNGSVALIGLKFELKEWLNGDLLSSLLVREENFNNLKEKCINIFLDIKNNKIIKNLKDNFIKYIPQNIDNFNDLTTIIEKVKKSNKLQGQEKGKYISILNNISRNNDIIKINEKIKSFIEKINLCADNIELFEFLQKLKAEIINNRDDIYGILNNEKGILKTIENNFNDIEKLKNTYHIIDNDLLELIKENIKKLNLIKDIFKKENKEYLYFNDFVKNNILFFELSEDMHKWFHNYKSFNKYLEQLFFNAVVGTNWEKEIEKTSLFNEIDINTNKIFLNKLNHNDIELLSKIILQFIIRKNPSPARLRRIWESTSEFFSKVKSEIFDAIEETRTKESFKKLVPDFANFSITNQIQYKQYFSIIDPTPISWQVVIPTSKVEEVIEQIQKLYYENFKYVNGKLPLHIGVVVQKVKSPLYVGIKALRNMRRDIKDWSEISNTHYVFGNSYMDNIDIKVGYANIYEYINNTKSFYSLYETDNYDYDFKLLPSKKGVKLYNNSDKFVVYPNTFDFEFLDTNTRRNDIFYQNAKRTNELKQNRPYEWSEWENFVNFKEFFNGKTALLHRIVSLIHSKIQDWKNNEESFKIFMNSTFKREGIEIENFGIKDYGFEDMKKFIDMFEFWHTALKEV